MYEGFLKLGISSLVVTCFEMRDLFSGGDKNWNEGLTGLMGPISSQLRNTFNYISILDSKYSIINIHTSLLFT